MFTRLILILMISLHSNRITLQRSFTPQNCTKRQQHFFLRNLRYKKQLLTFFEQLSVEKLFEKFGAAFCKVSRNLWKALARTPKDKSERPTGRSL